MRRGRAARGPSHSGPRGSTDVFSLEPARLPARRTLRRGRVRDGSASPVSPAGIRRSPPPTRTIPSTLAAGRLRSSCRRGRSSRPRPLPARGLENRASLRAGATVLGIGGRGMKRYSIAIAAMALVLVSTASGLDVRVENAVPGIIELRDGKPSSTLCRIVLRPSEIPRRRSG